MSDLKIFAKTIDDKARAQIDMLLAQPAFSDCKVRIMPDVHAGAGCVIGFTADLGDKVIPNIVGVDIGCGMLCVKLGKIDIDFVKLDDVIREHIPSGMSVHQNATYYVYPSDLYCYDRLRNLDWINRSMESLGGGNHFIEIDEDFFGDKYLVIHTGSRNLGKQVCEIYQDLAIRTVGGKGKLKEETKRIISECKANGQEKDIQSKLEALRNQLGQIGGIPDNLCYLEGSDRQAYLHDMMYCQKFAAMNRVRIASRIMEEMRWPLARYVLSFDTIHNYIDSRSNIVRKGAISAKKGERVLIPINMRDGCIIGIGKGNEDWNCSAPHGAGRIMSRMQAKTNLSMTDYEDSMSGIFTTSVSKDTIDEAPQAYKPMEEILECIEDTVHIERIIKPIYNFKAPN